MKKYLELYNLICDVGNIDIYRNGSASGLCDIIAMEIGEDEYIEFTELMYPPGMDRHKKLFTYWAGPNTGEFTPVRQNLLLLMAAINGELESLTK